MGGDAPVKPQEPDEHNPARNASACLPRKKRSLTRLLTAPGSSSRSRPPSPDDTEIPTTPTIPEKYLSTSRKASTTESPSLSSNGHGSLAQPVRTESRNHSPVPNEQPSPKVHNLKGILKPQTKPPKLDGLLPERETAVSPNISNLLRPRMTILSEEPTKDRSTNRRSPTFPGAGKATTSGINVDSPTIPPARNRGASTASLKLTRSRDSPVTASIPSRPATSGGEHTGRQNEDSVLGREDGHGDGLGLVLDPLSTPARFDDIEIPTSSRSAMTSNSSIVGASTAGSSVLTRDTSVSDKTVDPSPEDAIDEGMTVDEAIGMYEKGFVDDLDSEHENASASSISEEERRRSMKIAEAINDAIGQPPVQGSPLSLSKSASSPSQNASRTELQRPPVIVPPSSTRDQYGFLKASRYITITQYDAWSRVFASEQHRRNQKWDTYMNEQGCRTKSPKQFPDRGPKTLRYIRKGIPPAWRGAAWFYYSGGAQLLQANPDKYNRNLARTSELSSDDVESIERDLHRTFPDNIHFKPDEPSKRDVETPLLSSLRRVLQAFAVYRPQIGYCQSLNFLAGLLLLFLPEEHSFWMLNVITTDYLPGTHEISLEGANVDLWVLMLALKESSPSIWAKVGVGDEDVGSIHTARLPPISLCTTSWFMSMFIGTLPIESVLRVWDVVFYEGSMILFRIALAIFKMGEQRIKAVNDSMELFQVVQSYPRGILDIGTLMGLACRRGGINRDWIRKKRSDRRRWYATEKAMVTGARSPVDVDRPSRKGTPNLSRANSAWRRRVGLVK
ncbi:MAG: hypothetical protein LQ345_005079 [Seirophora villosa]|nr:MAG: hypothetical protein LQ345_005079 [Seirophora villosa]